VVGDERPSAESAPGRASQLGHANAALVTMNDGGGTNRADDPPAHGIMHAAPTPIPADDFDGQWAVGKNFIAGAERHQARRDVDCLVTRELVGVALRPAGDLTPLAEQCRHEVKNPLPRTVALRQLLTQPTG
jgi:hypothetical protein